MSRAGAVKSNLEFRKSYTLQFTNKAVGIELRPRK
jgi:NitT/TauT family transport system substrate-binding protein